MSNILLVKLNNKDVALEYIKLFFWMSCLGPIGDFFATFVFLSTGKVELSVPYLLQLLFGGLTVLFYIVYRYTFRLMTAYLCSGALFIYVLFFPFSRLDVFEDLPSILLSIIGLSFLVFLINRYIVAASFLSENQ